MKIYNFNENFIIKKLQKKEKEVLFNSTNYNVSQIQTKSSGKLTLVELLSCQKVFCCDTCMVKGDTLIVRTLEDNDVSLIDVKTGNLTKARAVDFYADMMIVTLENSSRRFIDKEGKIQDAEVGAGGFQTDEYEHQRVFVDEHGNQSTNLLHPYFVGLNGRVCAGEKDITRPGVYYAKTHFTKEPVYYSFLGNQITEQETRMFRDVYKFYKGEKKLKDLDNSYLLDSNVYNFIVDEVNHRLQNKFGQAQDIKGYYDKTAQQILTKLQETLKELEERREIALENSVKSTLENNTLED